MGKRKRKGERNLEEILEGLQELLGWQAELVREGLRQVREERPAGESERSGGKRAGRSD